MSKAFLFIALALIVACATAAQFTTTADKALPADCADFIYNAAGFNFVVGSWADQAAWTAAAANKKCVDALDAGDVTLTFAKADTLAAACFTATKPGAATDCGIANGEACAAATDFCVANNQCTASKCTLDYRYIWKFEKATEQKDVAAAITTIIEALKDGEAGTPCKVADAAKFTVVDQAAAPGTGKWYLTSWTELSDDCKAAFLTITPATLIPQAVQASTCSTCAAWTTRFNTPTDYYTCPCKDADVVIGQSRWKLVEGAKLSAAKDFYKVSDCLVAVNFVVGENSEFVLQTATKTSDECTKADPDADKKAEEWKKIATSVADAEVVKVVALAADCVSGKTIKCATEEKCASLRCAKGAACKTAADAATVCAGKCVAAKEGDAEGKCNSASVVGYVVAVVAVIAAFVF